MQVNIAVEVQERLRASGLAVGGCFLVERP